MLIRIIQTEHQTSCAKYATKRSSSYSKYSMWAKWQAQLDVLIQEPGNVIVTLLLIQTGNQGPATAPLCCRCRFTSAKGLLRGNPTLYGSMNPSNTILL